MYAILKYVLLVPAVLFVVLLVTVYLYFKEQYKFWKRLDVLYLEPKFPFGTSWGVGSTVSIAEAYKRLYDSSSGKSFVGIFAFFKPLLLIRDPELIKTVLIKDFATFHDRGLYVNEKDDPLAAHLFSISGRKWRHLRKKLTPTFTSGKMKMMFPIFLECAQELKSFLEVPADNGETVDVKEMAARFSTDVISTCAFGIESKTIKNPDAEFRTMGKKIFQRTFRSGVVGILMTMMPNLARRLEVVLTPKEVTEFFLGVVEETITYREKNHIEKGDFMQSLIHLKNSGQLDPSDDKQERTQAERDEIRLRVAAAQAFVFFLAGFETSSTTIQFALYELAVHPDLQQRVRTEIQTVLARNQGQITYEGVHAMGYLGRVIDETLRKYPNVPFLQRECNQNYQIPGTDTVIPKGVQIQIPLLGLHNDPAIYPNPERFDPERFTEEETTKRHSYAYIPFGEGPRNCIATRFGIMQVKIALITLLSSYSFEISGNTAVPLEFDTKTFILSPKGAINLKITHADVQ